MCTSNLQSLKRKRGAGNQGILNEAQPRKTGKTKKGDQGFEDSALDLELHVNKIFAMMNGRLLADYVAQRTRRFASDLSLVELEDQYLPGRWQSCLLSTVGYLDSYVVSING